MSLHYYFSRTGAVICQNKKGLIFFLPGEPYNCVKATMPAPRSPVTARQATLTPSA